MKNKISIYLLAIFCFTLFSINISQTNNENSKISFSLTELQYAFAADSEIRGKQCGSDECSVTYSIGVVTVTEHGHYYHCKTIETPGLCDSSACDVKCDAI
ncbi:hypothetical protein [Flavivirga rizhaonensis]|uniref:Uncharacterized protein n=1 Tax=Flavivirga rizhaonensis TaxID=2559571 RepID=A0A4S1DSS7_9FLAO|nr:hypothetical protein [Flavivirga rizhaonensis]TGV01041.1 hypothetical protein EM932_16920 [Flavivirga rizhaonensis]